MNSPRWLCIRTCSLAGGQTAARLPTASSATAWFAAVLLPAVVLHSALLPNVALAQTSGTWISTTGGLWSGTGNWSGGTVASGSGAAANFATLDITGTQTVNLDAAYTLGSLVFGDTGTSSLAGWVVANNGSSANTLTLAGGSTPTIGVNNMGGGNSGAGTPTGTNGPGAVISAGIAGSQGLTVNRGSGSQVGFLTLSGSNTYSGATTVAGTSVLVLANANALGGSTNVTIDANGGLRIADGVSIGQGKSISNNSSGINFEGGLSVAQGTGTWAGGLSGGGRAGYMSGKLVLSGSATGLLVVGGYGGETTTAPNFNYGVIITGSNHAITSLNLTRGVAKLGSTNAILTTGTLDLRAANATQAAAFDLNGFNQEVAHLTNSATLDAATAFLTNSAPTFNTLTVNQAGNSIVLAIIQGNLNLTKTGTGNLTLSPRWTTGSGTSTGTNTFAGVARVNSGTLTLGNANALFGSTVDTDGAGTLSTGALSAATFGALTGTSGFSLTRNSAPFTLSLGGNNVSSTYAATLSGSGGLTKIGTGTLTLTGTNTYEGTTTVSAGVVELANASALAGTGTVTFSGGTLRYGATGTAADVSGKIRGSGSAVRIDTNGQAVAFTGNIGSSNTGGLTKSGAGTLILSGTNSYTGGTTVTGGTLVISTTTALPVQNLTLDGGALVNATGTNNFGTSIGAISIGPAGGVLRSDARLDIGTVGTVSGTSPTASLTYGTTTGTASDVLIIVGGNNTYAGGTVLESGLAVVVDNNSAFGTGPLDLTGAKIRSRGLGNPPRSLANAVTISADTQFNAVASDPNLTFTGPVTLFGGSRTLQVDNVLTSGSSAGQPGVIFTNAIGDDGNGFGITKTGAGVLAFAGANTYTGSTTVSAGTLIVNGDQSAATGAVSVASLATLMGSGTIGGAVSILGGGIVAPGTSPGTLTVNNAFSLAGTSILSFEFDAQNTTVGGGVNDLITGVTNLTLDGILNVTGSGDWTTVADNTTWRLFNYTGTLLDSGLSLGSMPTLAAGQSFQIDTATAGEVNLVVVPEPTAVGLAAIGIAAAAFARRRKSRVNRPGSQAADRGGS